MALIQVTSLTVITSGYILQKCPGSEVHGLAFLMGPESVAALDKVEFIYKKTMVDLETYDGRVLKGFVYSHDVDPEKLIGRLPSKRYMGVIIKGIVFQLLIWKTL